ncbi:MAG TPA: peptidoglycan-binding protein, partial [Gemmatimonadaceae bacterium]|nr:peptidoglycan-binding protein [Gemmatimonadaceae bacterium]
MRLIRTNKYRAAVSGFALAFVAASSASAQSRVVLPAGTVIIVRTTAPLQSATAKTGQTFETNVEGSVGVDEYTVIPAGSRIRGVVSLATPATRQQSGVIEVVFDRLILPSGSSFTINGKLTSTDSAERRQIESDPNAHVVLVGERGGIGAAIAGAGSSKSTNNIFAALGSLLSEGRDVSVPAGTPLAVDLQSPVTLRGGGRLRGLEGSTLYTATDLISAAQQALTQQNYYRGAISGQLDDATRRALFQYQVDRGLSATGNLDGRTAQALGINVAAGVSGSTLPGTTLSAAQASALRRDAQTLVSRYRGELA